MAKQDEVKVKSRSGQEYVISNDGHHYRATKDGVSTGHAYVEVANLLISLDIEVRTYDDAVAGVDMEQGDGEDTPPCPGLPEQNPDDAPDTATKDTSKEKQPEVLGVNN